MPVSKQETTMPRAVDFKRRNMPVSDQAAIRRWSRAIVAVYASAILIGVMAAVVTSAPRLDNVAAQRTPAVVTFDQN